MGVMSLPSMTRSAGKVAPARRAKVGSRSMDISGSSQVDAAVIVLGVRE
jgi:hypothetical protein